MSGPIRADHVGSLLRPASLLRAREQFRSGAISRDDLQREEDAAILKALEGQQRVGLEIFTDGEFRRASWITDMAGAVDGFVPQSRTMEWHSIGGDLQTEASTSNVVGGRLSPRRRLTADQSSFLVDRAPGAVKMTLPAPSNFWVVSWKAGVSDHAYASRSEMLADVVKILREEVEALVREGVQYIQLDAPFYGAFIDPEHRHTLAASGVDPDAGLREVIAADNAVVSGLDAPGVTFALHICRGNSRSRWLYEGSYDPIAEALFGGLGVSTFLLEYDSPRDGDFTPLRFLPAGKVAVLGLVTSKEPELERVDDLRRRIDQATKVLPLEQLALSPQCGFASVAQGNLLSETDQWRKLERVVETARRVWS
jgi:5-methyltetrahydropteroyltriglutamate--homocysteine methyltransferase